MKCDICGKEFPENQIRQLEINICNECMPQNLKMLFSEIDNCTNLITQLEQRKYDTQIEAAVRWQLFFDKVRGISPTHFYRKLPEQLLQHLSEEYQIECNPGEYVIISGDKL